ncbi:hypothetical protein SAMN05421640_3410 [Ekhidna lutea]|uniref:Fructose 1,6-bisphosphatase n=1 Tax=Ekhidna lutea TaxID=447679 RepID=A0A239LV10_EKHLU|nr:hypothetical protein [Ekhidna lutea]SNT34301.1 hypothetical protein SAMN05421640_3410 [Ekhidna lutea]
MAKMFTKKEEKVEDPNLESSPQNGQQPVDPMTEESQKLNAVRDLLFGQNVQEYRSEFDELRNLINDNRDKSEKESSDMKSEIFDRLDKLEEKLNSKLDDTNKSINDRLDQLSDAKADRKKMATILHELANKLES